MSEEIAQDCGITYRQLDFWTRTGLLATVKPFPGSGRRREWPPEELRVAREMGLLTRAGMTPTAAAKAAREGKTLALLAALSAPAGGAA